MDLVATTEQERRIRALIEPTAQGMGFDLVRVRIGGGRRSVLQIMAERAGGAPTDVEDCARLSRAVGGLLDEADPISDAYTLEVSTPGIDRPLTRPGDFARWEGHEVRLELRVPVAGGRRRFHGVIAGEEGGEVQVALDTEGEEVLSARWDEIGKAALVLTDALIEAARAQGTLPPQPDEEGSLAGFEVEAGEDEDEESAEPTAQEEEE